MDKLKKNYKYLLLLAAVLVLAGSVVYKLHMDNVHRPAGEIELPDRDEYDVHMTDNMIYIRNRSQYQDVNRVGVILLATGRVDEKCYLPLMINIAEAGYDCFMPLSHGLKPSAVTELPDKVIRRYKSVTSWYIAGHADSCEQAAAYVKKTKNEIRGLIYIGGASDVDLSDKTIPMLSISGTRDTVYDRKMIEKKKKNDPSGAEYKMIEGANNTGFVYTDLLEKDSIADISFEDQIEESAELIKEFIEETEKEE